MGKLLLGFAASIAAMGVVTPAAAAPEAAIAASSGNFAGVNVHVGESRSIFVGGFRDDRRFRRRGGDGGIWISGGEWAHYNNRAFQSDSYNDWWHDQPWRSQPAWVRNNQDCRAYWSGGGWRC
jgi:hypothetical protein